MKTLSLCAVILFSIFNTQYSFAQKGATLSDATVKVSGNCGMCKKNIETAAKSAGASQASWDMETKNLAVSFNAAKTSLNKIEQSIAAKGYDTENIKATDAAYNKLHGCCQYERTAASETKKCCAAEKCSADNMAACKDKKCCAEMDCCKGKGGCENHDAHKGHDATMKCDKEKSCCKKAKA